MLQLVAYLDAIEEVGKDAEGGKIPTFAQDPGYAAIDKTFLAGLGIHVVDDPTAQRLVRRDVMGCLTGWLIDGEVMGQCIHLQPKLWIGNAVEDTGIDSINEETPLVTLADNPTAEPRLQEWAKDLRSFQTRHHRVDWPEDDFPFEVTGRNGCGFQYMWFEMPKTRRQMDKLKSGASCEGCAGGRRKARTNQFIGPDDHGQKCEEEVEWAEEASWQIDPAEVLKSTASSQRGTEVEANEDWSECPAP